MTPEEKLQQMNERNATICKVYMEGATLAQCGKQFGLKRQRIKQIVTEAGLWRERGQSTNERNAFLGIDLTETDKEALRTEASRQNLSMSAMTSEWIRDRLDEIHQHTPLSEDVTKAG